MAADRDWLAGGRVGRPHGLDGSFHVLEPRAPLLGLGVTVRAGGREAEIVRRAGTDERPILRLAGLDTRDDAAALGGTELLVPRAIAPALEEDEWWAEDLEGCRVVDGERELGRVARLVPLPSCEALEVAAGSEIFLVPLVRDAVRRVDVPAKLIDVDVAFLGDTAPAFARGGEEPVAEGSGAPAASGSGTSGSGTSGSGTSGSGAADAEPPPVGPEAR